MQTHSRRSPSRNGRSAISAAVVCVALVARADAAALPAFPGAEGYGANATGGRNGEVFHVNSLLATSTGTYEGPTGHNRGTLRWCLTTETSTAPRTIVFDVSGQVTLTSQITLENSSMTIAGQTAPGQGVTIAGRQMLVESSSNLIVRHIRGRLGRNGGSADVMGVEGGSNIIFDHVSTSWSGDEGLSVAKDGTLVSVQNSLIYEALNYNNHSYGSLIRPDIDSNVTYHHNLYADNVSRNPRPGTYSSKTLEFDFINNVVYNWRDRAGYSGGSSEGNPEHVHMNYVGNYLIAGPSTTSNANYAFITDVNADTHAYQSGNLIDSDNDLLRDGVNTGWGMFHVSAGALTQVASPFAHAAVTVDSADDAYAKVLASGGAFPWARDLSDARVVKQVKDQTGAIISHENDVGGYPALPALTRPAGWDTDFDGMPNVWETARGFNASLADHNNIGPNGYTNLENYLNYASLIANWNLNADGNWSAYLNWLGQRPGVMDSTANFVPGITAPRAVTVDIPVTVGQMTFDAAHSYTLAGANTITVNVISGKASIGVVSGSHAISAPLALADNTDVSVPAAGVLTVSNLQPTSVSLTKLDAGTLVVNNLRAGGLTVSAGTVKVAPDGTSSGTSKLTSVNIAAGAKLDLSDNKLIVTAMPVGTWNGSGYTGVSGLVDTGRGSGAWNGSGIVTSDTRAVSNNDLCSIGVATAGQAKNTTSTTVWAGQTVNPGDALVMFTWGGDANLDGVIDSNDYGQIDFNVESSGSVFGWFNGDFNYDGLIDSNDYGILDFNVINQGPPFLTGEGSSLASVPEPCVSPVVAAVALCLCRRRRGTESIRLSAKHPVN